MTDYSCKKYCNGNIVIVELADWQFPADLCEEYYIINREQIQNNCIWTCMRKEYYHKKIETNFDAFFDEMSIDKLCVVITVDKGQSVKQFVGEDYTYFNFGGRSIKCLLCIRNSAIPKEGTITFKVPHYIAGRIIGIEGRNINYVTEKLGRNVRVKAIQRHVVVGG